MTELLFGVLAEGLKLLNTKEGNKYLNKIVSLRQQWLEEYSKPLNKRDNESLDDIETALYLISKSFIEMGGKKQ